MRRSIPSDTFLSGPRPRFAIRASLAAAAAAWPLLLPACSDPACVFEGTCGNSGSGAGGGIGTEPASVPQDGEQLLSAAPTLVALFPSGTTADVKTPIVLTFSESMATTNLNIAFELEQTGIGTLPLQASVLIGDGHMVVLFPLTDLMLGATYRVKYRDMVKVTDRTGQLVVQPTDRVIGQFTTASATPAAPQVVATWPADATEGIATTGEIDVVFSRPMDAATIVDASFVVTTSGVAPANDPVATPVTLSGVVTDTRAYRYRSVDAAGTAVSLGTNAPIRLELSPTGNLVRDSGGVALANFRLNYRTATFSAPLRAAITSEPTDAIGIDALSGPANLAVRVDFADALNGDRLGLFLFGKEPNVAQNPRTIALFREFALAAPFTSFTLTADEIDLAASGSPLAARLADGTVNMAFYVKRGSIVSPVRLLDVDGVTKGVQGPVLDTVAPVLLGLSTAGNVVSSFRSDQRDLVLVGRASESLRAALVQSGLESNETTPGEAPRVVGASAQGLFVTAPLRSGVLAGGATTVPYALEIFDRALNSGGVASGQFTQVGAASNGAARPFSAVTVEVFNAVTLAPVVGATVYTHEDFRGDVSFVESAPTGSTGRAQLTPALLGRTIVTVDARSQGFDLFTFDGIPTDHVSIPLQPTSQASALAAGIVATTDSTVALYTRAVSDTRFPTPGETLASTSSCAVNPTTQRLECPFGPAAIRARELGAESAIVVLEPANPFLYSALTFLKAVQLALPIAPVEPGATGSTPIVLGQLLDLGTLDPEERPIDVLRPGGTALPYTLSTVNYPSLMGDPRVRVEATAPGFGHALTVGRGIAFDDMLPASTFAVRAAYPGAADGVQDVETDVLGSLVRQGTIEPDLQLRVEVVDTTGNRAGSRPRLSVAPATLVPPAPPALDFLPFTPGASGQTLDLDFADVLPDSLGFAGLYRVVLTDGATPPLSWTVWRLDGPDAEGPTASVHLPLIGTAGTLPLGAGELDVRVSAFGWSGFDPASFLWSDVEREFDVFAHAVVETVTPP